MKKIEAIVRPMRLEAVKAALAEEGGVLGMTVSDVRGFSGRDESGMMSSLFRGDELADTLSPKVKIEMVVSDDEVQPIVDLVLAYARTGARGDGKIFVTDMGDAIRIRTGDRGESAVG